MVWTRAEEKRGLWNKNPEHGAPRQEEKMKTTAEVHGCSVGELE